MFDGASNVQLGGKLLKVHYPKLTVGATISRCPLLNILCYAKNISVAVLEIVDCQVHLSLGNKKTQHSFVIDL